MCAALPPSGDETFLSQQERLLQLLLEQIRDHAVIELDAAGTILAWNRTLSRVFGYEREGATGQSLALFLPPDQRLPDRISFLLNPERWKTRSGQTMTFMRRDGKTFQGHAVLVPVAGSQRQVLVVRDLSVLLTTQDQLHSLATADQMTGLANRQHLFDLGRVEYRRWKRYRVPLSLLIFTADQFADRSRIEPPEISDGWLRDLANILRRTVRDVDLVARLEGGMFMCLLFSTPLEGAAVLAERLRQTVNGSRFELDNGACQFSLSQAVLTANDAAADFDAFMAQARECLERVIRQGGDRILVA